MKKILTVVIIIILALGSVLLIRSRSDSPKQEMAEEPTPTVILPTISDAVKVELVPKNGNKAVLLKVSGLEKNVQSVEYELTYMTGGGLPRGVLGKITVSGGNEIRRDDIVLGTCSSGKCVYDAGVKSVELSIKINSDKGSSVFRKTYELDN